MADARALTPHESVTETQIVQALLRANGVARAALAAGHHPFGALLVAADGNTVLLEQGNVDSVNHAEAVLARAAAQRFDEIGRASCRERV